MDKIHPEAELDKNAITAKSQNSFLFVLIKESENKKQTNNKGEGECCIRSMFYIFFRIGHAHKQTFHQIIITIHVQSSIETKGRVSTISFLKNCC